MKTKIADFPPALLQTAVFFALLGASLSSAFAQPPGGGAPAPPRLPPPAAREIGEGGNSPGYDMAPETRLDVVQAAVAAIPNKLPPGPFKPAWESLQASYAAPAWFRDAKFGIFMHWGLYSVPAHHNEWYEQHMYSNGGEIQWHRDHFGSQDRFGYKDFIPLFTAARWNPDAWAALFKKAGARYVVPTAQHHENFPLWDSAATPWNAAKMGPKRDLIGDLATAVRKQGMKFGVSNHGIENFQFIHPDASAASRALMADLKAKQADIYDPKWASFYNVADRSDAACRKFLTNWAERNVELIDKYQPDMLWFDNGVDQRYLDPLKLWIAAYYYNRARQWGKAVSISTKKAAYAPTGTNTQTIGSIIDFEKIGSRSPAGIRTGAWQVDHPIGSTWGYTSDMTVSSPDRIVGALVDTVSKNGNLLLNISPMADGTIPAAQQETLLAAGKWLDVNGEAIYGTHAWTQYGETVPRGQPGQNLRFTVKNDTLYAIVLNPRFGEEAVIKSLANGHAPAGKITSVALLGSPGSLPFTQDADGLKVRLPADAPCKYACTLKITGLAMNPASATWTTSGNPLSPAESPAMKTNDKPGEKPSAKADTNANSKTNAKTNAQPNTKADADAATRGAWGDRGNNTYANPVIPADLSDLDAIRVGRDYYAISSTFQYSPGMVVLHSHDLVNWTILGHAISDVTQLGPHFNWDKMNRYGKGIWAGSLRYHAGKFWIYFNTPDEGFFMTTATNPAGPWEPPRCLWQVAGWDDPCPFWEEDGQGYLVATHYADGYKIHLFRLSADGAALQMDSDRVIHQSRGSEANKLYKINGLYYHLYSEVKREGRVVMMERAKKLEGEWETRQLNHVNRAVDKEPNQGGLIELPDGKWVFFTHQGTGDWEGRASCLLPVTWQDGWPVIGKVGADGIGSMVWQAEKPIPGFELTNIQAEDEFNGTTLQPAWEWNHQPRPEKWSLTERQGWLRLHAFPPLTPGDFKTAGNTLTQRAMRTSQSIVTVKLDISGMADGQQAGIAHYARDWHTFGVAQTGATRTLTLNANGRVTSGPAIAQNALWLQSTWGYDGQSQFAYSLDGKAFTPFGPPYALTWGHYRGDRIGLFTFNAAGENGYVDVDWFHYTAARQERVRKE